MRTTLDVDDDVLARSHGGRLVTFDNGLAILGGKDVLQLRL